MSSQLQGATAVVGDAQRAERAAYEVQQDDRRVFHGKTANHIGRNRLYRVDLAADEAQVIDVMDRIGSARARHPARVDARRRNNRLPSALRRNCGNAAHAAGLNDFLRLFDDGIAPPMMADEERYAPMTPMETGFVRHFSTSRVTRCETYTRRAARWD